MDALGKDLVFKIYDLADVYHCDNIDRVSEDFIEEAGIVEVPLTMWETPVMRFPATGI